MPLTQNEAIKLHLEAGHGLTPLDALKLFGCLRLSARIFELKAHGLNIITIPTSVDNGKKTVATYRLIAKHANTN